MDKQPKVEEIVIVGDAAREFITTPGQQGGVVRPILTTSDPNVITMNGAVLSPVVTSGAGGQQWQAIKTSTAGRSILTTSDPNVITMNGAVLSPVTSVAGGQQWQAVKTSAAGGQQVRPILTTSGDPNVITVNGAVLSPVGTQQWSAVKNATTTIPVSTYYPHEWKVEEKKVGGKGVRTVQTVQAANIIDVKNVTPLPQAVLSQVQANNAAWGTAVAAAAPAQQPATVNLVNTDQGWSAIKFENAPTAVVQKGSTLNTSGLQFISAPVQTAQSGMNVVIHGGRKTGTIIETFKCEVCNQVFQSMAALQQHVTSIHEAPVQTQGKGKGSKKVASSTLHCEYKYSGGGSLANTISAVAVKPETISVAAPAAPVTPIQTIQTVQGTNFIAQATPQPAVVIGKNGKIKKEKKRNWQCDTCMNRFSRKDHLAKHVSAVHLKIRPFECGTCGQKFSQKHHLRAHMLARHEDDKTAAKAFACQQCSKRFTRNDHLERHIESVHEKRKQFDCAVCSHQFARKHHLSKHILAVHAKVKPYGCHLCDQSFLQRHHLGAHIMSVHQPPVHEEEDGTKTFVCAICFHRFKRKDHLKTHVETVHEKTRNYACQLCERRFGQKFHLAIHVSAVHEGKKPHSCHLCTHKSARKSGLQRHLKTVHNILPEREKQRIAQQQAAAAQQVAVQQQTIHLQQPQIVQQVVQLQPQTITGDPITVAVAPQALTGHQTIQGNQVLTTTPGIQLQTTSASTQAMSPQPVTVTVTPSNVVN